MLLVDTIDYYVPKVLCTFVGCNNKLMHIIYVYDNDDLKGYDKKMHVHVLYSVYTGGHSITAGLSNGNTKLMTLQDRIEIRN